MTLELLVKALANNWKFASKKGIITTGDLFTVKKETLQEIGSSLRETIKNSENLFEENFKSSIEEEKLEIVKFAYERLKSLEKAKQEEITRNTTRVYYEELLLEKKKEQDKNLSVEQLNELLKNL